ncbi:FAD-dependent oxidoreductase [Psychrobacter sp.]|uniref:NAD(P)/FAD-dependent oxidoreductase n=1 Tax=Psychrobacter sp. TaxID=56811 RepID=UPI0025F52068|nr:FAD-dependent oxidoreductase [Psychrobacter sp.]
MPASKNASPIKISSTTKPECRDNSAEDVVIVGAGMAGSRLAIKLATVWQQNQNDTNGNKNPKITLISKESEVGYNRIMLSPVLAGETSFENTYLYDKSDYEKLGIHVIAGVGVDKIDTINQKLSLDNGTTLEYSKLVIATGSIARVIPFPNHQAKGVHVFRDVADVALLCEYAKQGKTGLVIGGGVLGLEAACALSSQGAKMTVIHVDDYVLNRQLDLPASLMLQQELAKRNVGLALSAATTTIEVNDANEVVGLSLKDGRTIAADFIVMAVGIIPNIKLAAESGINVNRAIVVDENMHTSCPNVYAIGECVEINDELFGMVSSVNQHVESLIQVLTHPELESNWAPFVSVPLALKLKVSGIAVFSSGQIDFNEQKLPLTEQIVYRNIEDNQYHCLFVKENHLIGAVLYGETGDGTFYSKLINDQVDISSFKQDLIFGAAYCQSQLEEQTMDNHALSPVNADKEMNLLQSVIEAVDAKDIEPGTRINSTNDEVA